VTAAPVASHLSLEVSFWKLVLGQSAVAVSVAVRKVEA
jgi:hypothetical protein